MELNSLRKIIKNNRLNLTKEEVKSYSKLIEINLFSLPFLSEKINFFIYNSIKNEVETSGIIHRLKTLNKVVSYPVIEGENLISVVSKTGEFERGDFGVLVPKNYTITNNVEVAIIPLLLCDKNKNRVGYGKGYYDRFLKGKKIIKIGLAYDFQVVDRLTPNPWDVPLDYVVTPTKIF
ncbi:MAG: 5-formyltetrahydrofolate cyclo-ligase [Clostridia bacterium]|nr:5-formyltetrahydrofolate cyclo-ligase [Clostridia bacterium]